MWFVYIDRTDLGVPYYVGKGNEARINNFHPRSRKHKNVAAKYGSNRSVIFTTDCEEEVLEAEKHFISEYHTFVGDPLCIDQACNFTIGGDGVSGHRHSEETKERQRQASRGNKNALGYRFTSKQRRELSKRMKDVPVTGHKQTQATRDKIRRRVSEYWEGKRRREMEPSQ